MLCGADKARIALLVDVSDFGAVAESINSATRFRGYENALKMEIDRGRFF